MRILLLLAFCFTFLLGCQRKNVLSYAGYECWTLSENDILQDENLYLGNYESLGIMGDVTVPLSKVIKSDSFFIYIGISIENSMEEILSAVESSSEFHAQGKIDSNVEFYYAYIENHPVGRAVFQQKELGYPVIINLVAKDSSLINDVHIYENYLVRHNCK